MRACLVFLCLLSATFALSVKSKPHGKHHGLHKTSHTAKEKDIITEEANKPQILPTLVPFEASSQEQEDEELSSEDNANANKEEGEVEVTERSDKTTAFLLGEDELVIILKKEAEKEQEAEERALEEEEAKTDKGKVESGEIIEDEEAEVEEKSLDDKSEMEEEVTEEEVKEESEEDEEMLEKEEVRVEMMAPEKKEEKSVEKIADREEETDGSTESEVPVDLDYAADSSVVQPLHILSAKIKPHADDMEPLSKTDFKDKETSEKGLTTIVDDYEQDVQNTEAVDSDEVSDQDQDEDSEAKSKEKSSAKKEPEANVDPQEPSSNTEFESGSRGTGREEEKSKNDSGSHTKGKTRKQKKNQRARKHSPQRDETQSGQEQGQQDPQESEGSSTDNTVHKAKRRRAGKWGPLVGMNPVQIRATADLYPSSRSSLGGGVHHPEAPTDPCDNFPCKRGKTCKLDADNNPGCVCQAPSECPRSVNEFDHVCGTDNKTYETSCELFATKCNLEGTKRGHRLHLDYTGSCKFIPPCVDTELIQFPLRMRDWLKNVLLQLYEHDSMSPGFLTPKQRFRVKKIFESERRLHAGDHSVELLAQDFEKNYNMYIYPVHWQFAQLDQHPSDRFLSHSELAPLRVPLVPMEHCTSRFFQECDADKDKQVSFKEWTSCFGIKNEDMDVNQLF
ncbi:SPARC-like protein 1 [Dicentrarchus labrax]|uniref:SPARC-like protein 1 n=1 Tax=Dicentrarchus labrax TaxID=13489 RepID=A0A8C4DFZ6_DICLA|nr:SPARC-like protein 1 [Dicentrarchus labrax]XP_051241601.1 SPARC-like protein 1 [Dicentrarchus labrax]